ncbi:MAG: hypothetical protein EOO10_08460 [Chitinophagaceae bacterium]|nr:MAG: hypothetical protein EOO10_08460 [Chitinophagaceae bacterium]
MKKYFIPFLASVFAHKSFGQTELATIQSKLFTYTKTQLPEKVFLHTDKTFYTVGETIWFKVYVVDGVFHKPLPASKVAYIELLDKANAPVLRAKISLNEKGGSGSFQLPFGLSSGHYIIRGYTNWMKNMEAAAFFEEQLTIVNTLKSPEAAPEKKSPAYALQLFPEGGNLVNGLSSKVAFHVTDQFGKAAQGRGYLINEKNDTLSSFTPFKFGMGHFNLTPQTGDGYKVVFKLIDGNTVSAAVPKSFEKGYAMQLEELADNKLKITVHTNIQSGLSEIFLLAQTRQVVKSVQKNLLSNGTAVFVVDKNSLGEGVSQLTLFDNEKKPVCERLFFVQPKLQKNISLNASKSKYATREKVELSIPSLEGQATMSLAVYQLDELQNGNVLGIDDYLWLTSELSGTVEQPSYYFSPLTEEVKQATDYLMLTHGWRRFKWETVLNQQPLLKFQREQHGHLVTGKVTDIRTNTVAKGIQVYLSIPNSPQKLFTATSDSTGLVHFDVMDYFGQGEVIVQTNPKKDSFYRVDIMSPFAETYSNNLPLVFAISPAQKNSLINRSISMQANHLYLLDSISRFMNPLIADTLPFYGKPLYSYNLEDFVRFNTMEEVLREYVREISVGVKGSGTSLRFKLFNENDRELYSDDILVMTDGIPLFNANKAFSIDPLKIKRLDVINRNYVLGNNLFHGLANFTSYNGTYGELKLDPKAITIDYEGLQSQREFYSPDYSSETLRSSRLPDLRHTLLWMPDVATKQVNFYTGDNKGKYLVVLQGINSKGQTIHTTSEIEVQ